MAPAYPEIGKRKQAERNDRLPAEWRLLPLPSSDVITVTDVPRTCGLLTPQEIDITENYDATALAEAIASKKFKCVDVTRAYCKVASTLILVIPC